MARRPDFPTAARPPVKAMLSPIVIGSAARAIMGPARSTSAAKAKANARPMCVIAANLPVLA